MLAWRDHLRFEVLDQRAPAAVHAWREWVHAWIPGLRVQRLATAGAAEGVKLGPGRLWRVRTPAQQRVHVPTASKTVRNGFIALKLEGDSVCSRAGREVAFRAGEMWMGRASDQPFTTFASTPSTLLLLALPWSYLTARHPQLALQEFCRFGSDEPAVLLVREMMLSILCNGARLEPAAQTATLAALVELCGAPLASSARSESDDARVASALAVINQRLHERALCPTAVAAAVALSRRRLDELFVRALGATIAARIAEVRLERAAELLATTGTQRRIGEVALAVGYDDAGHFSRAFKARFRVLPKEYRAARVEHALERSGARVRRIAP